MPERKSLCAQISIDLHRQVTEAREALGLTTNEYVTQLITEYFELKKNGGTIMANSRTMAFQIPENLFQRIKTHLERETARTGRKLTQKEFVLGLIEAALDASEQREARVEPCDSEPDESDAEYPPEGENDTLDSVSGV